MSAALATGQRRTTECNHRDFLGRLADRPAGDESILRSTITRRFVATPNIITRFDSSGLINQFLIRGSILYCTADYYVQIREGCLRYDCPRWFRP